MPDHIALIGPSILLWSSQKQDRRDRGRKDPGRFFRQNGGIAGCARKAAIMEHSRRRILWLGVTAHPTAEWLANQLTEALGWEPAPGYLIRDRDACYGSLFVRRVQSLGIRDHPTSLRSPWQNGYAERLIGSIRRECLDHVVVFGERHLRHVLSCYTDYYNAARAHLSLGKDAPIQRAVQSAGRIQARPVLGGLHHQYARI
jgi:transposase InsO family protein